jgi:hypothetical protein
MKPFSSAALRGLTGIQAHVRAPQAQRAGPGHDIVARPDRALGLLHQSERQKGVGDAAGQVAHFIESEAAIALDIGDGLAGFMSQPRSKKSMIAMPVSQNSARSVRP